MNMKTTTYIAMGVVLSAATWAQAQNAVTVPINNWSYQRHSSTATEGYLRGSAAVIQAVGQKNYLDSVASVNYQEATKRRIENSALYVKTYFENKELNRQYREKYKKLPPTKEQWARITEAALPDRLTADQFDSSTGKLVWPHILRGDQYAAMRDRIDVLMAARTPDNSGDGSPIQRELDELIDGMQQLLKANIKDITATQYASSRWFLKSLDYEAFLPLTVGVAAKPAAAVVKKDQSAT